MTSPRRDIFHERYPSDFWFLELSAGNDRSFRANPPRTTQHAQWRQDPKNQSAARISSQARPQRLHVFRCRTLRRATRRVGSQLPIWPSISPSCSGSHTRSPLVGSQTTTEVFRRSLETASALVSGRKWPLTRTLSACAARFSARATSHLTCRRTVAMQRLILARLTYQSFGHCCNTRDRCRIVSRAAGRCLA
jgi:hypothetical protein